MYGKDITRGEEWHKLVCMYGIYRNTSIAKLTTCLQSDEPLNGADSAAAFPCKHFPAELQCCTDSLIASWLRVITATKGGADHMR